MSRKTNSKVFLTKMHRIFENESEFEKIVNRLNIYTESNPVHRDNLREEMLRVFNETKHKIYKQHHTAFYEKQL